MKKQHVETKCRVKKMSFLVNLFFTYPILLCVVVEKTMTST